MEETKVKRITVRLGIEFAPLSDCFPLVLRETFNNSLEGVKQTLKRRLAQIASIPVRFSDEPSLPTAVIYAPPELKRKIKSEITKAIVAIEWARWRVQAIRSV